MWEVKWRGKSDTRGGLTHNRSSEREPATVNDFLHRFV
jgi:hypothetical protein